VCEQSMSRGDLPPIAATLNKVLKRDAPGGLSRPGDFRFTARGTFSDSADLNSTSRTH
jgi:hypothetical protein